MIGRFANSQFFVLQQYESEQEVHGNAKRVQCSICGIHRVGKWPCTYRAFSIMDLAEEYVRQGTLDDDEFDNRMGLSAIHRPRAASWRPSLLTRQRCSSGNSSGGRSARRGKSAASLMARRAQSRSAIERSSLTCGTVRLGASARHGLSAVRRSRFRRMCCRTPETAVPRCSSRANRARAARSCARCAGRHRARR